VSLKEEPARRYKEQFDACIAQNYLSDHFRNI